VGSGGEPSETGAIGAGLNAGSGVSRGTSGASVSVEVSSGTLSGKAIVKLLPHFRHRTRADFHPANAEGSIRYFVLQYGHSRVKIRTRSLPSA